MVTEGRKTTKHTRIIVILLFIIIFCGYKYNMVTADIPPTINPEITDNTEEIIPLHATTYRYQLFATGAVPINFGATDFDDSLFLIGDAPFGSGGHCALQALTNTNWPEDSEEVVLRKKFTLHGCVTNLRVLVSIDNAVQVLINGNDISGGIVDHEDCPVLDEFLFKAPDSILLDGENLIAIRAINRERENYIDLRMLVDVMPNTTYARKLSSIKFNHKRESKDKASLRMCISPDICDTLEAGFEKMVLTVSNCANIEITGDELSSNRTKTKFRAISPTHNLKINCRSGWLKLRQKKVDLKSCVDESNTIKFRVTIVKDGEEDLCFYAEEEFTEQLDRKGRLRKLSFVVREFCLP